EILQVVARRKAVGGAGNQDGAYIGIGVGGRHRLAQAVVHGDGECVLLVRPLDAQRQYAVTAFFENVGCCGRHGQLPFSGSKALPYPDSVPTCRPATAAQSPPAAAASPALAPASPSTSRSRPDGSGSSPCRYARPICNSATMPSAVENRTGKERRPPSAVAPDTMKCRCGPLLKPVLPDSASSWPRRT